ncbi:Potassium voltage-gated channel subfamily KQT [Fructilactobacillus florum 8D]|uniref:Potassium voltage-gated channel subfamily KQT n=1 Tax=Fructilactobacillus florum 8D TaxID=1221538 RepID=W9EIJ5_9LACO|nr:ion channel [Fructilactobacillus florum]ETO40835.1 Potassium voltage-gated channel subfamily KQT [Fructilactobacillus florum 8D]
MDKSRLLRIKNGYNIFIVLCALVSVLMVLLDFAGVLKLNHQPYQRIDLTIWVIFVIDYFGGFFLARSKVTYLRSHFFDLLAIIPVNSIFSFFKLFRFTRLLQLTKLAKVSRLFRLVGIFGKLRSRAAQFLKQTGFIYLLLLCGLIFIISAGVYSLSENVSFAKALWWAVVTSSTVGYGDISPHSTVGRVVAVLLMLVGIGFVGMLTSAFIAIFNPPTNLHNNIPAEIRAYQQLAADGIITQAEFENKKQELLRLK